MEKLSVSTAWIFIILALGAGCVMALQPSVNARLASRCEHPLQASIISFGTGFIALLIMGLFFQIGLPNATKLHSVPTWAWTGGLLGTYMVTISMLIAPRLGATRWIALVLAGQIALSLLLDHFGWVGYAQHQITFLRLLGIGLVFVGVILVMFN